MSRWFFISSWLRTKDQDGSPLDKPVRYNNTYKNPYRDRRSGTEQKYAKRLKVKAMRRLGHLRGNNTPWGDYQLIYQKALMNMVCDDIRTDTGEDLKKIIKNNEMPSL